MTLGAISSGKPHNDLTPPPPPPPATAAAIEISVADREEPNGKTHADDNRVGNVVGTEGKNDFPVDNAAADIPRKKEANIGVVSGDHTLVKGGAIDLCFGSVGSDDVSPSSEIPLCEGEPVEQSGEQCEEQSRERKRNDSGGEELRVADDRSVGSGTDGDWIKISPPVVAAAALNTEAFFACATGAAATAAATNSDSEASPEETAPLDMAVAIQDKKGGISFYPESDGTSLTSLTSLVSRAATRVCRLWELVGSTGEKEAWATLARGESHRVCRRLVDYATVADGVRLSPVAVVGVDCRRDGTRLCHSAFGCLALFGRISPGMWTDLAVLLPEQSVRDGEKRSSVRRNACLGETWDRLH